MQFYIRLVLTDTVYTSNKVPYTHQWYVKDGVYFFTESEWIRANRGRATEKAGIAHFYDFKMHEIITKDITVDDLTAAEKLKHDFDPREHENCTTNSYKSPKSVGQ